MAKRAVIPVEKKTRIVLSILAGEMTIAEAARREKVSEQSIGRWKADFLEAGRPDSPPRSPRRRPGTSNLRRRSRI